MSDDELPDILTLLPRSRATRNGVAAAPRRSPRKQNATVIRPALDGTQTTAQLSMTSNQRMSPRKQNVATRAALKPNQSKARKAVLQDIPKLRVASQQENLVDPVILISDDDASEDELAKVLKPIDLRGKSRYDSQDEISVPRARDTRLQPTSDMSRITQAARRDVRHAKSPASKKSAVVKRSNPYVMKEAHCEDINESSGTDGEDEDTDLSGFIVADDAELSFHGSAEEGSSSEDDRRRKQKKQKQPSGQTGRRLVRGSRRKVSDSDDEDDLGLSKALDGMRLGEAMLEREQNTARTKNIEVIDLTSSPIQEAKQEPRISHSEIMDPSMDDTFEDSAPVSKLSFIPNLQPNKHDSMKLLPSKSGPLPLSSKKPVREPAPARRPTTPPATPPRSPSKTKLKSPTKLLSPSKHDKDAPRSPHRQSMAGFWDHSAVNDWHDTYSPKKAPLLSPRKNPLARFNLAISDDIEDDSDLDQLSHDDKSSSSSQDPFDDSSDSLPSPTASPSKSRSPSKVSALKAEQLRLREEKRAKLAAKKAFDSEKEQMANDLLAALDKYITNSKISEMSASTGGIQIIWSKTLRSTAGRANWKRTVSKPSGSPVKGSPDSQSIEKQPGVVVQHFASIELADKIIDRPERLVNTLAHEFCHLANFMVSGVRDQPHGESFKKWGVKVTSWLKSSAAKKAIGWREIWKAAEVTTKHSYVIETKYLWVCTGRPAAKQKQSLAMKMLNIQAEDEEGCGAEYGRHSKSIDVEKQRCGRCKGYLLQVRPAPRAVSSPKKSPVKKVASGRVKEDMGGIEKLGRLLEDVDLSD